MVTPDQGRTLCLARENEILREKLEEGFRSYERLAVERDDLARILQGFASMTVQASWDTEMDGVMPGNVRYSVTLPGDPGCVCGLLDETVKTFLRMRDLDRDATGVPHIVFSAS